MHADGACLVSCSLLPTPCRLSGKGEIMKSDSGSQECELCDTQPGSRPCMVIVQPTTASLEMRGQLALKKIFLQHICVREITYILFCPFRQNSQREEGERKRQTEKDKQRLDETSKLVFDSLQHTHQHILHAHLTTDFTYLVFIRRMKGLL